jgi:hypothetical protein
MGPPADRSVGFQHARGSGRDGAAGERVRDGKASEGAALSLISYFTMRLIIQPYKNDYARASLKVNAYLSDIFYSLPGWFLNRIGCGSVASFP